MFPTLYGIPLMAESAAFVGVEVKDVWENKS